MDSPSNLFDNLPEHMPEELVQTLFSASAGEIRVERIVSQGHVSPEGFWYDQDGDEWVVLLRGSARIRFEDGWVALKPGDFVNIPAHKRHRVEWTDPDVQTVWLAIHYRDAPPG